MFKIQMLRLKSCLDIAANGIIDHMTTSPPNDFTGSVNAALQFNTVTSRNKCCKNPEVIFENWFNHFCIFKKMYTII